MSGKTLSQLFDELKEIKQSMATKEDIANMATKEDISKLATKEDVAEIPYIKRAVHEISDNVNEMKKDMVQKEDLDYLYQKVAEHDRDIFKLKNRSF